MSSLERTIDEAVQREALANVHLSNSGGWLLQKGNQSLTMKAIHHGRLLTPAQRMTAVSSTIRYNDEIAGERSLPFKVKTELTQKSFCDISDNLAYKFCPENVLTYWLAGSIQVCPARYYQRIENKLARDRFEGYGAVGFYWQNDEFMAHIQSGGSHLILCLTKSSAKSTREQMKKKFGRRLIQINDLHGLCQNIQSKLGATSYRIHDVVYTDYKFMSVENSLAPQIAKDLGKGDMTYIRFMTLQKYFDDFLKAGELPSIFCKPMSFSEEKERRVSFSVSADSEKCQIVNLGDEIKQYIEVVV